MSSPFISASWDIPPKDIRESLLELDRKFREQQGYQLPDYSLGIHQIKRIAATTKRPEVRQAAIDFLRDNFGIEITPPANS